MSWCFSDCPLWTIGSLTEDDTSLLPPPLLVKVSVGVVSLSSRQGLQPGDSLSLLVPGLGTTPPAPPNPQSRIPELSAAPIRDLDGSDWPAPSRGQEAIVGVSHRALESHTPDAADREDRGGPPAGRPWKTEAYARAGSKPPPMNPLASALAQLCPG